MSGTNNPYEPITMFNKWMKQNEVIISEMQKNFEQVNKSIKDGYSIPAEMQKNFEQINKNIKDAYTPETLSQMSRQMSEIGKMPQAWKSFMEQMNTQASINENMQAMAKAMMSVWQQPREQTFIPNILLNWAAFKTSIGSNGRISIPEAERSSLGIREGDMVQVIVLPVLKKEVRE